MGIKKLKLSVSSQKKPIEPLEIFNKLTLRGAIENIWEPQAEALKQWHSIRMQPDSVIQMNTGGGKTLVGLIAAQSLLHELNRRVLYVVANNQLVEQTLSRAATLGIQVSARYDGEWHNLGSFQSADSICITNYAAVFNGFSTFRDKDVAALIFDDAHVAEAIIRQQYTLTIPSSSPMFAKTIGIFRSHFADTTGATKLQDITEGNPAALLFIPMFLVWKHSQQLRTLLLNSGISEDENTKFVWNHLSDHLAHCCVVASSESIEISPPVIPLHALPFFSSSVRRVYLTATLPSQASFVRTFGLTKPTIVKPGGKSGDAQRLFLFAKGKTDKVQRNSTLELIDGKKACIISPSTNKANQWVPPSCVFSREGGNGEIERFSRSKEPEVLGLVARYDGVDLPGDACRILVLDRLPRGEALFERFFDEGIRLESIRLVHTATRIVQAIGRIFRSNTDHGTVILSGTDLHDWIRNPSHRCYLPALLQQQVSLGLELDRKIADGEVTQEDLMDAVLTGDDHWDEMYSEYIDQFPVTEQQDTDDWYLAMLGIERKAYDALWDGNANESARQFGEIAADAMSKDRQLAAWYKHLQGVALLSSGDQTSALQAFFDAGSNRNALGTPSAKRDRMFQPPPVEAIGSQATALASMYRKNKSRLFSDLEKIDRHLVYGKNTKVAEDAMMALGRLLGLKSNRPDNEEGSGPDNLWVCYAEGDVWSFDLKTGKDRTSNYDKTEIALAHSHAQWVTDKFPQRVRHHAIVGHELPISNLASPSTHLEIIDLSGFRGISENLRHVLNSIEAGSKDNLEEAFEGWMQHYGLIWPNCVLALPSRRATELRED